MTDEVKSCPFCGGGAELYRVGNDHHKRQEAVIDCKTMGCTIKMTVAFLTGRNDFEWAKREVIKLWNTRRG